MHNGCRMHAGLAGLGLRIATWRRHTTRLAQDMDEQLSPSLFPDVQAGCSPARSLDELVWITSAVQHDAAMMAQQFAARGPPSPLPGSMFWFPLTMSLPSTTSVPECYCAASISEHHSTDAHDDTVSVLTSTGTLAAAPAASTVPIIVPKPLIPASKLPHPAAVPPVPAA